MYCSRLLLDMFSHITCYFVFESHADYNISENQEYFRSNWQVIDNLDCF